jgi:hypothetical protein
LFVFVEAGTFADEQDFGVGIASTGHSVGCSFMQSARLANSHFFRNGSQHRRTIYRHETILKCPKT